MVTHHKTHPHPFLDGNEANPHFGAFEKTFI